MVVDNHFILPGKLFLHATCPGTSLAKHICWTLTVCHLSANGISLIRSPLASPLQTRACLQAKNYQTQTSDLRSKKLTPLQNQSGKYLYLFLYNVCPSQYFKTIIHLCHLVVRNIFELRRPQSRKFRHPSKKKTRKVRKQIIMSERHFYQLR